MAAAWIAHQASYHRDYSTLHHLSHTVQFNLLSIICVKHSVTYILVVHRCTLQLKREIFITEIYIRKTLYEKCSENLVYGFLVFQCLQNQECLRAERGYFQQLCGKLHIFTHYIGKCKAVKLTVHLGSVCSWTPRTNIIYLCVLTVISTVTVHQ
jgi:hypothetical protein